jgi:hypothetical protein
MTGFKTNRQKASEVYRELKFDSQGEGYEELSERLAEIDPRFGAETLGILRRIAKQYPEEVFIEAVTKGNLPPVKLTQREMEVVNGGNFYPIYSDNSED